MKDKEYLKILRDFNTPWKMWLYFLKYLPTIIFYGIKIEEVTPKSASIIVPFTWRTQNPFHSIYAGAQFAAAEISTGLMASLAIKGKAKISMLITHVELEYTKKAKTKTTFTCSDGQLITDTIDNMITTNEAQIIQLLTIGTQQDGEIVSRMKFTWSFKLKNS